jgi:hypothetical protein
MSYIAAELLVKKEILEVAFGSDLKHRLDKWLHRENHHKKRSEGKTRLRETGNL